MLCPLSKWAIFISSLFTLGSDSDDEKIVLIKKIFFIFFIYLFYLFLYFILFIFSHLCPAISL